MRIDNQRRDEDLLPVRMRKCEAEMEDLALIFSRLNNRKKKRDLWRSCYRKVNEWHEYLDPAKHQSSPAKEKEEQASLLERERRWRQAWMHLPNLKILELVRLNNLIMTPDFDRIPNLERLILRGCQRLKKIHPSIGNLERLIFLSIEFCSGLKIFPPIKRLKKLETLSLSDCPKLFKLLGIQQKMNGLLHLHSNISGKEVASYKKYSSNFVVTCWTCGDTKIRNPAEDLIDVEECCLEEPYLPRNNNTVLRFFPRGLRKLNLRYCSLGDKDIDSAVWEFPNLEELNLKGNKFSRLNFSRWQLPQLKWLDVSLCQLLVELWDLPSSIAVVIADNCWSLESFGDISNCKWLWKVSLCGYNKLGPLVGDILLDSMLQVYFTFTFGISLFI
ncbi:TMV resistance protein N-like [Lactuca sativa]|uniref:TMV resistance protein N-like n=1 Tax=Lactuca sativa TaxID=4236 RepID=UPI0022AFDF2A|nr:TMV resistance protein N-like [Lactuca sativa]